MQRLANFQWNFVRTNLRKLYLCKFVVEEVVYGDFSSLPVTFRSYNTKFERIQFSQVSIYNHVIC